MFNCRAYCVMACAVIVVATAILLLLVDTANVSSTNITGGNIDGQEWPHSSMANNEKGTKEENENNAKRVAKEGDIMSSPKFWLWVHLGCGLALSLHTKAFADQRFSLTDRLFYSYAFSLIVLLPARYVW